MKKNVVLSVAGMLLCLALFACTRNIGDGCVQNVDCSAAGDRFCDIASPGGYCTVEGCDYNTCPDGAACVRFYTLLRGEPACPAGCRPGDRGCCRPDEQCLCGGKGCYCASETSERRWCMRTCDGEGQGSCREGYQCAKTRESGAIPVPRPGVPMPDDIRFCAPAPQS